MVSSSLQTTHTTAQLAVGSISSRSPPPSRLLPLCSSPCCPAPPLPCAEPGGAALEGWQGCAQSPWAAPSPLQVEGGGGRVTPHSQAAVSGQQEAGGCDGGVTPLCPLLCRDGGRARHPQAWIPPGCCIPAFPTACPCASSAAGRAWEEGQQTLISYSPSVPSVSYFFFFPPLSSLPLPKRGGLAQRVLNTFAFPRQA